MLFSTRRLSPAASTLYPFLFALIQRICKASPVAYKCLPRSRFHLESIFPYCSEDCYATLQEELAAKSKELRTRSPHRQDLVDAFERALFVVTESVQESERARIAVIKLAFDLVHTEDDDLFALLRSKNTFKHLVDAILATYGPVIHSLYVIPSSISEPTKSGTHTTNPCFLHETMYVDTCHVCQGQIPFKVILRLLQGLWRQKLRCPRLLDRVIVGNHVAWHQTVDQCTSAMAAAICRYILLLAVNRVGVDGNEHLSPGRTSSRVSSAQRIWGALVPTLVLSSHSWILSIGNEADLLSILEAYHEVGLESIPVSNAVEQALWTRFLLVSPASSERTDRAEATYATQEEKSGKELVHRRRQAAAMAALDKYLYD